MKFLWFFILILNSNVAVELVANGFARASEHRGGESRSKDYEDILKAETLATKSQKGLHTPEDKASILYINEISVIYLKY